MGIEFPKEFIQSLVEDNTRNGNVIKTFCDDLIGASKDKLLVIISKSKCGTKMGCVLINSDNYPSINNTFYLKSLQLGIYTTEYPSFLTHDSFIDCSDIKERSIQEIEGILKKDPKRMVGQVSIEKHKEICDSLKANKTIPTKIKKLYYLE